MGLYFLRRAEWLTARRTGGYLWLLALVNCASLAMLLLTSQGGIDRHGFLLGSDFLSFWTSGLMLGEGGNPYDVAAHIAAQQAWFKQTGLHTAFFYPPLFLPLCRALGLVGYFPALALWLLASGAALYTALRLWLRETGAARPALLLIAAFPASLIVVTHGQTAFLAAALLGAGTLLVAKRPWLAGVLIGLAAFKPQLGLLVPLVLLLTLQWRTIAGAALAVLLSGAAVTLAYGPQVWIDWWAVSSSAEAAMASGGVPFAKLVSLFAAARLLDAPVGLAYALQIAVALWVAIALVWACRHRRYTLAHGAAMLAGAPLVTPFVLDYDLVLLGFPLLWLAARPDPRPWERIVVLAGFIAPAFARTLAMNAGIPIMPVMLVCLFALLVARAERAGRREREWPAAPAA